MMTIRSHDQYNTTIYGLDDRYRGIKGNRRIIMMNPDDMLELQIKPVMLLMSPATIMEPTIRSSEWTVIPYKIPKRNISILPRGKRVSATESTADTSNTPTSKWIICTISGQNSAAEEEDID